MAYILLVVLVVGLLMFYRCEKDAKEVGRMMFFAAVLALLIALAPITVVHLRSL